MHEVDAGGDRDARRQLVATDLDRLGEPPDDDRDDRPQPQGLLDRRGQVRVRAGLDLIAQALELLRMAAETLDRPGERGRGRLVAGDEQGEQLVTHLFVAHRAAVPVSGADQHREDVVALLEAPRPPVLGDLAVDEAIDPLDAPPEGPQPPDPVRTDQQHRQQQAGVGG